MQTRKVKYNEKNRNILYLFQWTVFALLGCTPVCAAGEWTCLVCGTVNPGNYTDCMRCLYPWGTTPEPTATPKSWTCPVCNTRNGVINSACWKCYTERGLVASASEETPMPESTAATEDEAAQNGMGDKYYYGLGVEQSYTKTYEWYMKAAEQGDAQA